eukprot:TRINITY_DN3084_c0_g1_i1.p1 TRINITY_DN3084_c0_g1~~TRINITY_DN3084_c0_g1_i1.p1  ORF type:complete len:116 (-),score=22.55 TRINITY_DN3084_c0_g1_i1:18-365(-)
MIQLIMPSAMETNWENMPKQWSKTKKFKESLRQTGRAGWQSGKGFAVWGAVWSGTECAVEKARGKTDLGNSLIAGCITGIVLTARAGPQASALGCAGMSAVSLVFDSILSMHPYK